MPYVRIADPPAGTLDRVLSDVAFTGFDKLTIIVNDDPAVGANVCLNFVDQSGAWLPILLRVNPLNYDSRSEVETPVAPSGIVLRVAHEAGAPLCELAGDYVLDRASKIMVPERNRDDAAGSGSEERRHGGAASHRIQGAQALRDEIAAFFSGVHKSSSSVGGAASAARVIGGSEQPTEEAPSLVEIDDVPLTMLREGLTPVIEAAAEAAAARLRRESQVRAEREREQELRLREERVWAAWIATTPRLFLLRWAREHATDTKGWPDGARQMAMCVEQLFDAVRGEREDLWRELLELRRELDALRGAAGGVS